MTSGMRMRVIWYAFALGAANTVPARGQESAWDPIRVERSPGPRAEHAMTYDAARREIVFFGGRTSGGVAGDTWIWSATGWNPYFGDSAPPLRRGHAMVYHASLRRTVLFGGRGAGENDYLGDTWIWRDGGWYPAADSPAPAPRTDHAMAFDVSRNATLLFGGRTLGVTAGVVRAASDSWIWNGTGWEMCSPGTAPPARWGHAMAYDESRQGMVVFGGQGEEGLMDDFWEWDGIGWHPIPMAATPPARADHCLAFDEMRSRLVLFGGRGVSGALDDTWEWDGVGWRPITPESWPNPRHQHAMVYDASRRRVVLYGGESEGLVRKDFWEYPNPATYSVSKIEIGPAVDVAVAWTESTFAVVREVGSGPPSDHWIVLDRLDSAGNPVGASVAVASGHSPLAAGGVDRFGLVFQDTADFLPRIFFVSVFPSGDLIGVPQRMGTLPTFDHVACGDLAYGGGLFALVSDLSVPGQPGGGVELTRILPDGGAAGAPTTLSTRPEDGLPGVAFGGDLFGVAWLGEDSIRFSVVDGEGRVQFPQDQRMLDVPQCYDPQGRFDAARIIWNGSGFGFYLNPGCGADVFFASITADGVPRETSLRARGPGEGDLLGAEVTWDGRWYAVADNETYGADRDRRLTFWRFWSDGVEKEVTKRVPMSDGPAQSMAMEWDGEGYGLAWVEDGTAYFSLIHEAAPSPVVTPTPTVAPRPTREPIPTFARSAPTGIPERIERPTRVIPWTPAPPDRNGDGIVNSLDLFMFAKDYGEGSVLRADLYHFAESFHQWKVVPTPVGGGTPERADRSVRR